MCVCVCVRESVHMRGRVKDRVSYVMPYQIRFFHVQRFEPHTCNTEGLGALEMHLLLLFTLGGWRVGARGFVHVSESFKSSSFQQEYVLESVTLNYNERVVGASNRCTHITDAQSDKISTAVFFK